MAVTLKPLSVCQLIPSSSEGLWKCVLIVGLLRALKSRYFRFSTQCHGALSLAGSSQWHGGCPQAGRAGRRGCHGPTVTGPGSRRSPRVRQRSALTPQCGRLSVCVSESVCLSSVLFVCLCGCLPVSMTLLKRACGRAGPADIPCVHGRYDEKDFRCNVSSAVKILRAQS